MLVFCKHMIYPLKIDPHKIFISISLGSKFILPYVMFPLMILILKIDKVCNDYGYSLKND